jgi:hypothetical protein
MDLGPLLNSLNQSIETATISQVAAGNSATPQPGLPAAAAAASTTLTVSVAPGATPVTLTLPGGLTVPGGTAAPGAATSVPGTTLTPAGLPAAPGGVTSSGFSISNALVPMTAAGTSASGASRLNQAAFASNNASADVYYGSGAPTSPSLLSQSGVGAYIQLVNALASHAGDEQSADQLTNSLGNASATLKTTYNDAISMLPAQLQGKDWGFSVFNGKLVFTAGDDALTPQDFTDLQKAFAASNSESAANQLAGALTSIGERQKAGDDTAALAWGRIAVDENNFSDVVNLRDYVTGTAPGGRYSPGAPPAETRPEIPNILGGMDLRGLASARPEFFRANGTVVTDEPDPSDIAELAEHLGTLQGQCSCGEVRFTVENAFEYAFFCHCSRCRLRTGSAFATIAGIAIDKVEVSKGQENLLIEGECSDGYGARCSRCYAFLFAAVRDRQYMHVSLGVLTGTPNKLPDHHIYVGSKAPWFEISDALPQYDELP